MSDKQKGKSHAFSIILIMIVLMLVGAACIPLLNVQYEPKTENLGLSVNFSGKGSARVIESEITSVIEGALNTVAGVSSIRATSRQNGGYINLTFKKGTDMEKWAVIACDQYTSQPDVWHAMPIGGVVLGLPALHREVGDLVLCEW